uniref:RNA recognition motif-containing protein n=1 Tax=Solanum tuberosum TaxID=4113 RepID=M1D1A5_SOLTU
MALFCSPCNNSLISSSISFTSSAIRHVSAFKPQFPSLSIFSFKQSNLTDLSQKKPYFPKCSGSSVEQHNDDDNYTTIIFLKDDDSPPRLGITFQNLIDAGLAKSTPEGRLKVVFSQFGDVSRVKIITDKKSKESLGFAYIWFPDNESAQAAVQEMNGKVYTGSDGKAWILQAEHQDNALQVLGNPDLASGSH